jgi:hypothetical protein
MRPARLAGERREAAVDLAIGKISNLIAVEFLLGPASVVGPTGCCLSQKSTLCANKGASHQIALCNQGTPAELK